MFKHRKDCDSIDEFHLKPCPFCKGDAELLIDRGIKIRCRRCGISTPIWRGGSISDVSIIRDLIRKWNKRAFEQGD